LGRRKVASPRLFHYPPALVPNVYTFKDFEGSSHRILIDLIRRFAPPGGTLLDLGAAGGELGDAVRDHFDSTCGFEFQVDCIGDLLPRFDRVVIADLERVKSVPGGANAVVLADVLEHLHSSTNALALVKSALAPNGRAFISVPNVANVTVRLMLLLGMFEYQERGILDRTHIRFYTQRSILREVQAAGFRILKVTASSIPLRLVIGGFTPEFILRPLEKVLVLMTRLWRSMFAYQIIIVAERP
jgi:predicted TPR repeat methyltransferase